MNNAEKFYLESNTITEFTNDYFRCLSSIFEEIDKSSLTNIIDLIIAAGKRNSCIYLMGNGGSAATSSHFANDLSIGVNQYCKILDVRALTDNVPILTAIANDYNYESIFQKQLEPCLRANDLVIAYSASGNSLNVINAVAYANDNGAITVSFTGFSGGKLRDLSKHNMHVPSKKGDYGLVEDAHLVCNHTISSYLINYYKHNT